jgi:hypothetical protein
VVAYRADRRRELDQGPDSGSGGGGGTRPEDGSRQTTHGLGLHEVVLAETEDEFRAYVEVSMMRTWVVWIRMGFELRYQAIMSTPS